MTLQILDANPEDARNILALQKLAYQSEALLYNNDKLPPLVQTLEEMEQDIRTMTVLKAVQDREIIGSVRANRENGICRIGRLIVAPACQGRGIGTKLMQAVEDAFPLARAFELFTGDKSVRNIRLYERLGYVRTRTQVVSPGLTLVFLTKTRVLLA